MAGIIRTLVTRASSRAVTSPRLFTSASPRTYATVTTIPQKAHHRVVIIGGGTAGLTVAAQLARTKQFRKDEIAIVDERSDHDYQPGWTLVGAGLKPLSDMHRPMASLIPQNVVHYPVSVGKIDPDNNLVEVEKPSKGKGRPISYDYLIVAPGLRNQITTGVRGLRAALHAPTSNVSSIYDRNSVEKTWTAIQALKRGSAIFTQPAGVIKCAGAPQKIMWMALSQWEKDGVRKDIQPTFATGGPAMFAVPKYSKALEELRIQRNVEGLFQHNLTAVDHHKQIATFQNLADNGKEVQRHFDFLHVVPPQKPHSFVAESPLADAAGWVDVDKATTQHVRYPNVFSLGDASSLPNSKTAAAVASQAPVLVDNLLAAIRGDELKAGYTGYASCPLLTGHGELMLCEFKYGGVPDETFAKVPGIGSQDVPRRVFYHLKKDFFPKVYWNSFVKGTWFGRNGFFRPDTTKTS